MASRKSALQTIFSGEELPSPALSDVIKSGWLTKRSVTAPGPFKNWRRRYIVLKQHVIIWRHNEDDLRDFAAGGATRALTFGSNVSIVAESHGKRTLCLRISSTYGSLVLEAASADERDAWMDAVARAAAPPAPAVPAAPVPAPADARAPAPAPALEPAPTPAAAPIPAPASAAAAAPAAVADDAARRAEVLAAVATTVATALARVKVRREEEVAVELAAEADALVQKAQDGVKARRWSLADIFRSGGASDEAALRRLDEIAGQLEAMGKSARAAAVAVYAVDARRRAPPPAAAMVDALSAAAELLELAGRSDAARPYFEEAADLAAAELGDGRARVVAEANLGAFLLARGDGARGEYERAAARCAAAADAGRRSLGDCDPDTLAALSNLGAVRAAEGDAAAAKKLFSEALAGCTDVLGKKHPQALVCEANVACLGGDAAPNGMPSAGLVVWQ